MHAYVEYVALHGRTSIKASDLDSEHPIYEVDELVPGFSGAHLGGGTDPAIGFWARNAVRGAWIALHLQRGGVVVGNRNGHTDVAVPDKAWLTAEGYLKYALTQIDEIESTKKVDLSLAKREILMRLAEVDAKLSGPRGLAEAKRLYSLILMDGESASPPMTLVNKAEVERRLSEIDLRLLDEVLGKRMQPGHLVLERQRALKALAESVKTALSACQGQPRPPFTPAYTIEDKHVPGKTGLLNQLWTWFSEDEPESSVVTNLILAPANAPRRAARTALSCLTSLVTSLVATDQTLLAQFVVHDALLQITRFISDTSPTPQTDAEKIHLAWLKSRESLLLSYQAEITHALQTPEDAVRVIERCDNALQDAIALGKQALTILPTPMKKSMFASPSTYSAPLAETTAAARKSGALAARTRALLAENNRDYRLALENYELILEFVETPSSGTNTANEQGQLRNQAIAGIRRTREHLTPIKR